MQCTNFKILFLIWGILVYEFCVTNYYCRNNDFFKLKSLLTAKNLFDSVMENSGFYFFITMIFWSFVIKLISKIKVKDMLLDLMFLSRGKIKLSYYCFLYFLKCLNYSNRKNWKRLKENIFNTFCDSVEYIQKLLQTVFFCVSSWSLTRIFIM